jgi:hypothetical protein
MLAATTLSGCYTYVPSGLGEIRPEEDVRVRLDPGEATRLESFVKRGTRAVEGKVVEQNGDSLLLLVESHSELRGDRVQTLHQRVQVAHSGVLDVELRRLDKGRTYMATGIAVAALAVIASKTIFGDGGGDGDGPGPPPDESVIPAFSWRFPLRLLALIGR